jgi:unsaturated pyranuronate lyase
MTSASFFDTDDFGPLIEIAPGVTTRVLVRGSLMFSLVEIEENGISPLHHHPEEQMGLILEGQFERHQGGEIRVLGPGEGFHVPPDVEHGGKAVGGPCRILDVFSPPRAKYLTPSVPVPPSR